MFRLQHLVGQEMLYLVVDGIDQPPSAEAFDGLLVLRMACDQPGHWIRGKPVRSKRME